LSKRRQKRNVLQKNKSVKEERKRRKQKDKD